MRWTWLAGDPPTVCLGFLAFAPALDQYICSVLSNARVSHHFGVTQEDARDKARQHVESTYGAIRVDRPERHMVDLRIGRWNGVALLLGGEDGIALQEEWVEAVSRDTGARARGYFSRIVQPCLAKQEHVLLEEWVATGEWDSVPIDAVFAAGYPHFDYLPD